jgi:hypothetical protein
MDDERLPEYAKLVPYERRNGPMVPQTAERLAEDRTVVPKGTAGDWLVRSPGGEPVRTATTMELMSAYRLLAVNFIGEDDEEGF